MDSDPPFDADELWTHLDRSSFCTLFFAYATEAKDSLDDVMTAKEAWTALAQLYQSPSRGNKFRLTTIFHSLHQQPDQPALAFINQVITAAGELKDLGEDISDQKIKYQTLGHLSAHFDYLVTTSSTVDTDNTGLIVRQIREYILREESTIKQKNLKLTLKKPPTTAQTKTLPLQPAPMNCAATATSKDNSSSKFKRCNVCG